MAAPLTCGRQASRQAMGDLKAYLVAVSLMVSPGPNTVILTIAASHQGLAGGLRAAVAIAAGTLAVYCVLASGLDLATGRLAKTTPWIGLIGSIYLLVLATRLVSNSTAGGSAPDERAADLASWKIVLLQLVNPNLWILLIIFSANVQSANHLITSIGLLSALAVAVTPWILLGVLVQRRHSPRLEAWVTRMSGGLLLVMAALLIVESVWTLSGRNAQAQQGAKVAAARAAFVLAAPMVARPASIDGSRTQLQV
jgi:threonine/homoserine/homoserine lactone efflux protein